MKNYSNILGGTQQDTIFGRTDMAKNNAGGFGFKISNQEVLERFLVTGSEGGTYYVGEKELTKENSTTILEMIKQNGIGVVETATSYLTNNRAPKADMALFVLALACSFGDATTKKAVYAALPKVTRTATHLFLFLSNIQNLRGWSRGLRKAVSRFYTDRSNEQLALQLVKYRSRADFTHKDAIRLAHPATKDEVKNNLLRYAIGKITEAEAPSELIQAYGLAQTAKGKDLVAVIGNGKLTWEMIPTEALNDKAVLTALVDNMPLIALMRNLNRFAYNDLTDTNNDLVKKIVAKLTSVENVKGSGVHPINVVNSMLTYASGRGFKGSTTWKPNQNIVDALQTTYELALKSVIPTNKNILIGVDVSGSMNHDVNGMQMNAAQISNVLAVSMLKTEPNAEMVWFDTVIKTAALGRRSSLDEVIKNSPHGGGTDCSQPIAHALRFNMKLDAIVILTDNESWAGTKHGFTLLEEYRKKINPAVKLIEVAMVANHHSTMPGDDKNILRVVGFDASVVEVINKYLE